ncbi:MAG: hypothetical protein ACLFRJ_10600, partial [Ectothiorhodospira sp.]
ATEWVVRRGTQRQTEALGDGSRAVYLPPEDMRRLWSGMQRQDPAKAALLQEEGVQALRETFGAELLLEAGELREFMQEDDDDKAR